MDKSTQRFIEMLDRIQKIQELCQKSGGVSQALSDTLSAQPAIMMHFIIMQEQITKLQNDAEFALLEKISKENLRGLLAVRNIASHDYDGINFAIIEDIIHSNLPKLAKEIEEILREK
ncbi:HepT-like ribonuclease domain-containing protein [Helicobacter sp. T3_23-1059]